MTPFFQSPAAAADTLATGYNDREWPAVRTEAVHVVFTTIDETFPAERVARDLATAMGVPLTLIHFRTVPVTGAGDGAAMFPPAEIEAFVARLRAEGMNVRLRVYVARSDRRAIPFAFKPHSLIVLAGRHHWWPTRSERWRRALEAAGHFVVFVDLSERMTRAVAETEGGTSNCVETGDVLFWIRRARRREGVVERGWGPASTD